MAGKKGRSGRIAKPEWLKDWEKLEKFGDWRAMFELKNKLTNEQVQQGIRFLSPKYNKAAKAIRAEGLGYMVEKGIYPNKAQYMTFEGDGRVTNPQRYKLGKLMGILYDPEQKFTAEHYEAIKKQRMKAWDIEDEDILKERLATARRLTEEVKKLSTTAAGIKARNAGKRYPEIARDTWDGIMSGEFQSMTARQILNELTKRYVEDQEEADLD